MPGLSSAILGLRGDPRLLKLPPYLSLILIVVGLLWLLILPLDEYARHTYISENALLPGQVHTYFGGSEHNVFRAYRHEVAGLVNEPDYAARIAQIFQSQGLKVGRQNYSYEAAGQTTSGENAYALLQGPRADATEAMVLMAGMRDMHGEINYSGVALVLTMARYFKRWSLWSKDILFVITADSFAGPQAWVDAYHDQQPVNVDPLPIKSGALQAALNIEYPAGPGGHRFDKLHFVYDGINGQLPNLDLFNSMIVIAKEQVGITCAINRMWRHDGKYQQRLQTVIRAMMSQGLGHATGPHSSFMPYHVDAISIQTVGDGWHDEMSFGRVIESGFRSVNNLLEKLHQSFFFYVLLGTVHFVSIATYLPAAMLIAVNFSITSIALWLQSGRPRPDKSVASTKSATQSKEEKEKTEVIEDNGMVAVVPAKLLATEERDLALPLTFLGLAHLSGLLPLYILHSTSQEGLPAAFLVTSIVALLIPFGLGYALRQYPTQSFLLISCFSLLVLGVSLATLSCLNFSLGLITGLMTAPLSFIRPLADAWTDQTPRAGSREIWKTAAMLLVLTLVCPSTVILVGSLFLRSENASMTDGLKNLLVHASFAWHVNGTWTSVVIWVVWWPAWLAGAVVAASRIFAQRRT